MPPFHYLPFIHPNWEIVFDAVKHDHQFIKWKSDTSSFGHHGAEVVQTPAQRKEWEVLPCFGGFEFGYL